MNLPLGLKKKIIIFFIKKFKKNSEGIKICKSET